MEIVESPDEDSTDNDDDNHDDQSDQPKKSVRFYEWGKSGKGKITKIFQNLSVTDAIGSLKQQIAVLKRPFLQKVPKHPRIMK